MTQALPSSSFRLIGLRFSWIDETLQEGCGELHAFDASISGFADRDTGERLSEISSGQAYEAEAECSVSEPLVRKLLARFAQGGCLIRCGA